MKKFFLFAIMFWVLLGLSSCEDPGISRLSLTGIEESLPDDLKGLKIYQVSTGQGNYVNVAVLNNRVNSTTYQVGKTQESTIIVNQNTGKAIIVSEILVENDSIVVAKKIGRAHV